METIDLAVIQNVSSAGCGAIEASTHLQDISADFIFHTVQTHVGTKLCSC